MTTLEAYYEQGRLWDLARYEADADQRRRAEAVAAMLDASCDSVLDVGCGSGFITRRFRRPGRRVVGLDPSREALARFDGECVCGRADALPFPDKSFDAVACTEVLEHLPDDVFAAAVGELARVARRQIVIGVPCREGLYGGMTRCADCGTAYHISLHRRSFAGPKAVAKRFPAFALRGAALVGRQDTPLLGWVIRARQRLVGLDLTSPFARCPHCGSARTAQIPGKRIRKRLLDALAWRLPHRTRPKWMIVNLERRAPQAGSAPV